MARFVGATEVGPVRSWNEDAFLVDEALGFALVLDGTGGHCTGVIASAILQDELRRLTVESVRDDGPPRSGREAAERLQVAIESAHRSFCAAGATTAHPYLERVAAFFGRSLETLPGVPPEELARRLLSESGAAVIAAWAIEGELAIAHVGDCRAYRVEAAPSARETRLVPLTREHSLLNACRDAGKEVPAGAEAHYARIVTQLVSGTCKTLSVERCVVPAAPGDQFLLCTDGLWEMLEEPTVREVLTTSARALVTAAGAAGGKDNATAVLVSIPS